MGVLFLKYLTVYLSSMVKFVAGPLTGLATGLGYVETVVLTALGMMTTVFVFTFLGKPLRSFLKRTLWKNKKRFTRRNRQFVYIWKRWGIPGVSFLTPLILSPIGGALLVSILGGPKKQVIFYMLISAFFWGFVICGFFFFMRDLVGDGAILRIGDWVIWEFKNEN